MNTVPRLLRPAFGFIVTPFMPLNFAAAMAVAGLAVSAGSAYSAHQGAAKDAEEAEQFAERDAGFALAGQHAQIDSIEAARTEQTDKTTESMSAVTQQAMIERGRIMAGAGESGVAGPSVAEAMMTTFLAEQKARGAETSNLRLSNRQANRDIRAIQAGAQATPRFNGPSTTASVLKFAGDALSIGSAYLAAR